MPALITGKGRKVQGNRCAPGNDRSSLSRLRIGCQAGRGETCNCGLTAPKDTDNHIVLVDPTLGKPKLTKAVESESETAEFTPRVRLDHPTSPEPNCNR
jgi:hypothetical protein